MTSSDDVTHVKIGDGSSSAMVEQAEPLPEEASHAAMPIDDVGRGNGEFDVYHDDDNEGDDDVDEDRAHAGGDDHDHHSIYQGQEQEQEQIIPPFGPPVPQLHHHQERQPQVPDAAAAGPQRRVVAPVALRLMDEEEWYNINGLRDEPYGRDSYTNQQEALERVQQEQRYQLHVHTKLFREQQTKEEEEEAATSKGTERRTQLDQWTDHVIELHTSSSSSLLSTDEDCDSAILKVNLKDLATHSDTVFAMASNRHLFSNDDDCHDDRDNRKRTRLTPLSLPLQDYSKDTVQAFLNVLFQEERTIGGGTMTVAAAAAAAAATATATATAAAAAAAATAATVTTTTTIASSTSPSAMSTPLPDEHVVDCCRLAHYLQCQTLLNDLVGNVLLPSVDSDNCMSLCHLADQLGLPSLLEASLNHMQATVADVESEPMWGELAPDLRHKIQTIQGILASSNRKYVYFSTFNEYLALLSEQYQYYAERLDEAVDQQRRNVPAGSPSWTYAQQKIDQQAERLRTLKFKLMEQKKVFGNRNEGKNMYSIYNTAV